MKTAHELRDFVVPRTLREKTRKVMDKIIDHLVMGHDCAECDDLYHDLEDLIEDLKI